MKFRGLDPRTQLLRWGSFALIVGLVLGITLPTTMQGLTNLWYTNSSTLPWVIERLFGFLAYFAIAGSVVYGLLLSTKILDAIAHRPITFSLHKDLALVGLGLVFIHALLLLLDNSVSFNLTQIAVPGLSPYNPVAVAAGQISLYLLAIIVLSFYVRKVIKQKTWRLLHYLTFLAYIGATVHGIAAGSDSGSWWAWTSYVTSLSAVVFLATYRLSLVAAKRLT